MQPRSRKTTSRAVLTADVFAAIALTLVMLVLFNMAVRHYAVAQEYGETRRLLRLAAEAEISRLRAGTTPVPAEDEAVTKTVSLITTEVTVRPGTGEWRGLALVRVVAHKGGKMRVVLSAYVPESEGRP